ncbi:MAG: hypothetical protein DME49_03075 [Verrucomicrobia bacterium]|nr:MAG: hypothetical protein DME49_03075 [Verrucomicrobiota bacterium]
MQFPNSAYSGYSSLDAAAHELLKLAEKCYGECVKSIKISVKEWESDHPETFFNQSFTHATIKIQKVDENERRYQLAQEVVQCLSPVPPDQLTFFEKGLGQVFALSDRVGVKITPPEDNAIQKKYAEARRLCALLEKTCGEDIVHRLRKKRQQYISRITPDDISALCSKFPREDAELLCRPWNS